MMIVMKHDATEDQIRAVVERIESTRARARRSAGEELIAIGAIGDRGHIARLALEGAPGVDRVVPILKPYKLASLEFRHGEPSVFEIGGRKVGGEHFALIAGPCSVESQARPSTGRHRHRRAPRGRPRARRRRRLPPEPRLRASRPVTPSRSG